MKPLYLIPSLILGAVVVFTLYNTYKRATSPQHIPDPVITTNTSYQKIVFAGGCFWCTESEFDHLPGVITAISGYAEASTANPRYAQVGSGEVKAREAVEVTYDPKQITIEKLLEKYWRHIDPTDAGGQFADRGYQYTTAIYYTTETQKVAAAESKNKIDTSKKFPSPVATIITPFVTFYPAEEYHQKYKEKNPVRYNAYKEGSGRNAFIRANWEDNSPYVQAIFSTQTITPHSQKTMNTNHPWENLTPEEKAKRLATLTPEQFNVTQKEGTERPYTNLYAENHEKGLYVDIVSGEPLFLSVDKYDSGTGWPSFVKPVSENDITLHVDKKLFSTRTEVRSKIADSHLGHVFDDGPSDRGGKRYCMNSASMRFIPLTEMEKEGYGEYVSMIK